jgi:type I restriction enzyme, S subunit
MPEAITNNLDIWTSALLAKSTAGRGNNGKLEAYGIKKLRELILDLAVRGKLVPQDPNDESASTVIEEIAESRTRLIKEGIIKKQPPLAEIEDEEIPFDIPDGWLWQRLGAIGYTQTGGTPSKTNKEYLGGDIPFIKPGDIYPNYVDYNNEGLSHEGHLALGRSAPANSILMVCIGTIGKCNSIDRPCAFNQQINSITPYIPITEFLLKAVRSNYFQMEAWQRSSSTTIAILNKGKWNEIIIPLPPLAEQHRIVAKVDELMAQCDQLEEQQTNSIEAHQTLVEVLLGTLNRVESQQELTEAWNRIANHFDTLFTTEQSVDQLKQTILQLAIKGKLVPQDPNDEPALALLGQIAAHKAELSKNGRLRGSTSVNPMASGQCDFQLPPTWVWARFGELMINRDGERIPVSKEEREAKEKIYDYYGASGVIDKIDGYLFDKPLLLIGEDGANLINRSTPIAFIARGKYWVNNHAHVLDGISGEFLRYIELHINAINLEKYVTGSAQPKMNQAKMNTIPIALPPLSEQQRIVARVDELMALCDALKARLNDAQTTQIHLADAIVEQAVS